MRTFKQYFDEAVGFGGKVTPDRDPKKQAAAAQSRVDPGRVVKKGGALATTNRTADKLANIARERRAKRVAAGGKGAEGSSGSHFAQKPDIKPPKPPRGPKRPPRQSNFVSQETKRTGSKSSAIVPYSAPEPEKPKDKDKDKNRKRRWKQVKKQFGRFVDHAKKTQNMSPKVGVSSDSPGGAGPRRGIYNP